jgi:hypothetical protein
MAWEIALNARAMNARACFRATSPRSPPRAQPAIRASNCREAYNADPVRQFEKLHDGIRSDTHYSCVISIRLSAVSRQYDSSRSQGAYRNRHNCIQHNPKKRYAGPWQRHLDKKRALLTFAKFWKTIPDDRSVHRKPHASNAGTISPAHRLPDLPPTGPRTVARLTAAAPLVLGQSVFRP